MSTPFLELFSQSEIEILLAALQQYQNHCKKIGNRKMSGYGKASELEKRDEWKNRADEVESVISKVMEESC